MSFSFIITESMLKNKGRELMLEFYNSIHDEYFLNSYDMIKSQRKYWDENVVKKYKKVVLKDKHLYKDKDDNIVTFYTDELSSILFDPVTNEIKDEYKDYKKIEGEDMLKYIEDEIKDKTIELKFVFNFLKDMDEDLNLDKSLEFEINEDLYCLKKAFLNAYDVFYHSGYIL